jgi:hypothetical protein
MTIRNRYLEGLANAFAWSSSRHGRWILPLILVTYFLTLAALATSHDRGADHRRGLVSAWPTLGVAASHYPFLDTRFITATVDCHRLGYDTYVENPCDPVGRPMNYPRIWLALASLGLTQGHTVIVGIGLAVIFFGCLLCWAGRLNPAQSLTFGIFLCSPPVMWIIERGNMDQVWVRRYPKMRPVLYVSIILSLILKLYPAAGMLVVGRDKPRRTLAWGLIILITFSAYIFFTWPDLILMIRSNNQIISPATYWCSYGRMVLFDYIGDLLRKRAGVEVPLYYLAYSSWVAVGIATFVAFLWAARARVISKDSDYLDSFLLGSSMYLGTFLIGYNYDYKLVFLVFLLPQSIAWVQDRGQLARPAYLLLFFLMISVWGEFLRHGGGCAGQIQYGSGVLLQELANWLLFISILKLNIMIMRQRVKAWGWHSESAAGSGMA